MAAARRPAADGEQVFDRPVGRFAGVKTVNREAERREVRLKAIEHRSGRRGDAGAGDQRLGQVGDAGVVALTCQLASA